jgi:hypothetical protein
MLQDDILQEPERAENFAPPALIALQGAEHRVNPQSSLRK